MCKEEFYGVRLREQPQEQAGRMKHEDEENGENRIGPNENVASTVNHWVHKIAVIWKKVEMVATAR